MRFVAAHYEGPLPPAAEFARYETTHSGAAYRILRIAETEQESRGKLINRSHATGIWRVVAATIIPLSGLAVSAFAYYLGHPGFALPLGSVGFWGVAYKLLRAAVGDEERP